MLQKKFNFTASSKEDFVKVSASDLYDANKGYGFVTEAVRNADELLKIPELNSAFDPWYWLAGEELTKLSDSSYGVTLSDGKDIPLIFKADLGKQGNYRIKLTINGGADGINGLYIFTGRRRMMARDINIAPGEAYTAEYTINICDIVPRGKTEPYTDTTLDIALVASVSGNPTLASLEIEAVDVPTIYIAGDSTVTDQSGAYPYDPGCCYSGWAQVFPMLFDTSVAVSNHAHSGLTTESFRGEGHHAIVEKYIKPGDYFFMQFAHNDQKLQHLDAYGGYANNLRRYVNEIREKGATPIIVTPICRNTWKPDGTYNDLLFDYDKACKQVGEELSVPVLNLHDKSMAFILEVGLEAAKSYYMHKDYTHSNDYGAYKMAHYVAEDLIKFGPKELADAVKLTGKEWVAPEKIIMPQPPADFEDKSASQFAMKFKDLDKCPEKDAIAALTAKGIIPNEENFRPNDIITRVEALAWIIKAVSFVPVNVYNDMYPDVIGHEWYAGTVESAYQNKLVDAALTADGKFHPLEEVTAEQLVSFMINAYKSRKNVSSDVAPCDIAGVSDYAKVYVAAAKKLNFIKDNFEAGKKLTRAEACVYVKALAESV
ncbi:MAG: S-layer homology domain-containing protein [Lachnospiraceae bacterium]|nr:S-layer homology domain-containing protein [Lachnospiraceae bacterium]